MAQEKLEKILAHRGIASRRGAKTIIEQGLVQVNGVVITVPSFLISPHDTVIVDPSATHHYETYLVYKPRGIETNKTKPEHKDIHDIFPELAHLAPIGRLDKESEGLILVSNDGVLAKIMTQSPSVIDKEYLVTVQENITPDQLHKMAQGIIIDKQKTRPAQVTKKGPKIFSIILHEGRKHQIRRMANAVGLTVIQLVRIRIGHITTEPSNKKFKKQLSQNDVNQFKKLSH